MRCLKGTTRVVKVENFWSSSRTGLQDLSSNRRIQKVQETRRKCFRSVPCSCSLRPRLEELRQKAQNWKSRSPPHRTESGPQGRSNFGEGDFSEGRKAESKEGTPIFFFYKETLDKRIHLLECSPLTSASVKGQPQLRVPHFTRFILYLKEERSFPVLGTSPRKFCKDTWHKCYKEAAVSPSDSESA